MKIDGYAHILPPKFAATVFKSNKLSPSMRALLETVPALFDLNKRFRIMDKYPDVSHVVTLAGISVDDIAGGPKEAVELARMVNDEMAELVYEYPERFAAAAATLPMNDMDAALKELDRAINELKLRGVLIRVPINGKAVDLPEFMPLYEKMNEYNLPIWFHPQRRPDIPDYAGESGSKYHIWHLWGIVYESTVAMTRLALSGVMERYPRLKIIIHHCGAMVPFFAGRIILHYDLTEMRNRLPYKQGLPEPPIEYFRRFYVDTAIAGNTSALKCAYDFFGAEHILFGTDAPMDPQFGDYCYKRIIPAIEQMDIPDSDKKKIFEDNARKVMRLPA